MEYKQIMKEQIEQLHNDGYLVLKDVFNKDTMMQWRHHLINYFSDRNNCCKVENYQKTKPDAINYKEFDLHLDFFRSEKLISVLREACGGELKYAHHYDTHIDIAPGKMHHDGGIRHLAWKWNEGQIKTYLKEKYDLTIQELCRTNTWKDYNKVFEDTNNKYLVKGEELLVYRVGTYLQDHSKSGGLAVLKGSHKKPHKQCKEIYAPCSIGDVVIWDCRVFHAATGKGNNRCFVHTALGKPNFLLDLYIEATQARVTKQNSKSKYVLREELKQVLDSMKVLY
jgi:hypothetical protein